MVYSIRCTTLPPTKMSTRIFAGTPEKYELYLVIDLFLLIIHAIIRYTVKRWFSFSTTSELLRIPVEAIVYVEADGNYSTIVTADGVEHVLTLQIGQIERRIADVVEAGDHRFIRIGKSLIVNSDFISFIHATRQKLVLSDCRTFSQELSASREALKTLKEVLEKMPIDKR